LAFAATPAAACLLEVGLGGRLDATNVIERPLITGIANLALDHQQFLGDRLRDIAGEKAAIAKRDVPLVTQLYPPAIANRIAEVAHETGARWLPRGNIWDASVREGRLRYHDERGELDLPLPRLPGRHQALNAGLAVAMLRHQDKVRVTASACRAAMGWADWPARLQHLADGPLTRRREVWLDGAHNPSAARQVAIFARKQFAGRPLHLVFASLTTKDPLGILEPFAKLAARVHCVPIPGHSCFAPSELVEAAAIVGIPAEPYDSVEQALAAVPADAPALILGSLYLAGTVLAANDEVPD
jgi:dihydrofolate synthase/folylpolyglutamate synthase